MESIIERSLAKLIETLIHPSSIFILGAGASSPEIPTTAELKKRVLRRLDTNIYSISAGLAPFDEIQKKFLKPPESWKFDTPLSAIGATPEALRLAIHQELAESVNLGIVPPQYKIFEKVPTSAKILTFNSDGLASKYCPQPVFEIHGCIIPDYLNDLDTSEIYDDTQIFRIPWHPANLWYPEPETNVSEEMGFGLGRYRHLLADANSIVIIGYSFGLHSEGWDDAYSFNVLCENLRDRDTTIVIVDPFGEELVRRIEDSLRNRSVFYVPFRWNLLAQTILKVSPGRSLINPVNISLFAKEILTEYSILERNAAD